MWTLFLNSQIQTLFSVKHMPFLALWLEEMSVKSETGGKLWKLLRCPHEFFMKILPLYSSFVCRKGWRHWMFVILSQVSIVKFQKGVPACEIKTSDIHSFSDLVLLFGFSNLLLKS